MAEEKPLEKDSGRMKKPVYTMDVMRLVTINELSRTADMLYIQVEQGYGQNIVPLRATLKTLYQKIKRFTTEFYPTDAKKLDDLFSNIETTFNFDNWDGNDQSKFMTVKKQLVLAKETIDALIDEVFTKTYEILPEADRARLYSLGRA